MNKGKYIGRLAADPRIIAENEKGIIVGFVLMVSDGSDSSISFKSYGDIAQNVYEHLKKGAQVMVKCRAYQDHEKGLNEFGQLPVEFVLTDFPLFMTGRAIKGRGCNSHYISGKILVCSSFDGGILIKVAVASGKYDAILTIACIDRVAQRMKDMSFEGLGNQGGIFIGEAGYYSYSFESEGKQIFTNDFIALDVPELIRI